MSAVFRRIPIAVGFMKHNKLNTSQYCMHMCLRSVWNIISNRTTRKNCIAVFKPSLFNLETYRESFLIRNLFTMKMDTQEYQKLFTPELKDLVSLFEKYNYELRIAGGAVRDLMMGKQPHDVDFATTATPDMMKDMFKKEKIRMINTKGETHGTITCRINDKENFEVTTLRIDVSTDGRHAEVAFTTDWELDSLRRDLTINSMFLGFDGTLYDYFNGVEDLQNKKVRFVGDAPSRIQEDYLRILRYFRFYGRIADEPDAHEQETLRAIQENMDGLEVISGERIWVELKKILTGRHAGPLIRVMMNLGLAKYIGLSDNPNTDELYRVWERCHDLEPLALTLLPALIRDENQGFLKSGMKKMYKLHERIKLSRDELRLGLFILQHREDDFGPDPFRYCKDVMCDTAGKEPKTKDRLCELLKYLNLRETLQEFQPWIPPRFPINGIILLEMGVPKGPGLAKMLNALREIWKQSDYNAEEKELLSHVEELKQTIS